MSIVSVIWILTCVVGFALSLKSAAVLGARSRATVVGWLATALYFIIAAIDGVRGRSAPAHVDYVALAILTIAFVVAGVRDEAQAEPWWWPSTVGLTGAQRRAREVDRKP